MERSSRLGIGLIGYTRLECFLSLCLLPFFLSFCPIPDENKLRSTGFGLASQLCRETPLPSDPTSSIMLGRRPSRSIRGWDESEWKPSTDHTAVLDMRPRFRTNPSYEAWIHRAENRPPVLGGRSKKDDLGSISESWGPVREEDADVPDLYKGLFEVDLDPPSRSTSPFKCVVIGSNEASEQVESGVQVQVSHRTPEEEGPGVRLELEKEEEEEEWRPEPQNHRFGGEGRYPTRKEVRTAREQAFILARRGVDLAKHDPREVQSSLSTRLSSSTRNSDFSIPPSLLSELPPPPNVVSIPSDNPSAARNEILEPSSHPNATAELPTRHEGPQIPIALRRQDDQPVAFVEAGATSPLADYDTPSIREERRQRLAQCKAELKAKAEWSPP